MKPNSRLPNLADAVIGVFVFALVVAGFFAIPIRAADSPGVSEKASEAVKGATEAVEGAVKDAKEAVQDAGKSVSDSVENLWARVDKNRLKNRTPDQIVAWVIMGVLVGAVAGMMTSLRSSGLGKLGRLLLGLAGAFIGGMIVHVGNIDFGMGFVLMRYEELLFSFAGAILLIVISRFFRSRSRKTPAAQ